MSANSSIPPEQLQTLLHGDYILTSCAVLFLFECAITLSQEVEVMWARRWMGPTWLYLFTRYTALVLAVICLLPTPSIESYTKLNVIFVFVLMQLLQFAAFSALRAYMLLDRNIWFFWFILLLNLIPLAMNIFVVVAGLGGSNLDYSRKPGICISNSTRPNYLQLRCLVSITTRLSVILSDVLILLVTWVKTIGTCREARRLKVCTPFMTLLIRDGTLYFGILLVVNVLMMVNSIVPSLRYTTFAITYSELFTPLLICRFLLNLRQVNVTSERTEPEQLSTINFFASVRFVGNMGESLYLYGDDSSDGPESSYSSPGPVGSGDEVELDPISLNLDPSESIHVC